MAGVVVGMESNKIAMQDTKEDFIAHWEDTVDLAAWKRGVEEEANLHVLLCVFELFPEHSW